MLPYKRSKRVGHLLRRELSDIITNRVKDPRLGFLTVTDVSVTDDLKFARAYISVMKKEEREPTMEALDSARSFVRSELARRLHMKNIPAIEFRLDSTAEYGSRIERLLKDLRERG